jgi:hypothetical protein
MDDFLGGMAAKKTTTKLNLPKGQENVVIAKERSFLERQQPPRKLIRLPR